MIQKKIVVSMDHMGFEKEQFIEVESFEFEEDISHLNANFQEIEKSVHEHGHSKNLASCASDAPGARDEDRLSKDLYAATFTAPVLFFICLLVFSPESPHWCAFIVILLSAERVPFKQ